MAPTYALHSEPATTNDTELLYRLCCVPGASRLISTVWAGVGTYQFLVNRDDAQNDLARYEKKVHETSSKARFSQPSSCR